MDRRSFVGIGAAALAAASLPGCASFVATPVTPVDGVVRLPIRNHPQLEQPGGSLRIMPAGGSNAVYVLVLDDGTFAALSSVCTHLQCTVNIDGARLQCPCHGSTYDRSGQVLRGPAERPLQRYATRVEDGMLLIRLNGEAS